MMLGYTFVNEAVAARVEAAVENVLARELRTGDIHEAGAKTIANREVGGAVLAAL
jgi:3-isopropylmalate dehydrogenase